MPPHAAAIGYSEYVPAPDFLTESPRGDENCTAGDGIVPALEERPNRQINRGLIAAY